MGTYLIAEDGRVTVDSREASAEEAEWLVTWLRDSKEVRSFKDMRKALFSSEVWI